MGPERPVIDPVRLAVATPTHDGRAHLEHAACVDAIRQAGDRSGIVVSRLTLTGSHLARMRCQLVTAASGLGATHILMLDEDVAFADGPRALGQLLGTMRETGAGLVSAAVMVRPNIGMSSGRALMGASLDGALAGVRSEPMRWACALLTSDGERVGMAPRAASGPIVAGPGEALLLGCGALLIDMRVFASLDAEPFRFADGLGEDHWFSREVQRHGHRAALDPRAATVHLGRTGWAWEGQQ